MATLQAQQNGYSGEFESPAFGDTPFAELPPHETQEEPLGEAPISEALAGNWVFTTPFLPGESTDGETQATSSEVAALAEITTELKDGPFREALEQLASEALEAHADQLSGEYGDRETRDAAAERLLSEHFQPLAEQAEAMVDRLFEQFEGYSAEALTDQEIDRIITEVLPAIQSPSPASEQFLGGWARKIARAASGAVNLAKRGVQVYTSLAGKLALGPLRAQLKKLIIPLFNRVMQFALNKLPASLQPLAQKLSDRLYRAVGTAHEGEGEDHEQTEAEAIPAAPDAGRLEAEFDVQVAQLLLTPDAAEADHVVSRYEEEVQRSESSLAALDSARAELAEGLAGLQSAESAQPVIEHFVPAVMPALQLALKFIGRPKVVNFIARLLSKLIQPLIGANYARMLSPAIADAGLHMMGLESTPPDPGAVANEALAATVEETLTSLAELPAHAFEDETVLATAVREAFDNAASSYFPDGIIKPELRETADHQGMWVRKPLNSEAKRYAKYSQTLPVTISPKVAEKIGTFGGATLHEHLRDQMDVQGGKPVKAQVSLYQAGPGGRASTIARAEGFPASQLHPLTPQAAGALLGPNAALGNRATPGGYQSSGEKLHVKQRLYRVHTRGGRHHRHIGPIRSELLINLQRDEIQLWLYLSERLCQHISAELAKGNNAPAAFAQLKPLVGRTTEALKIAMLERHLPPELLIVGETPNLDGKVPPWLRHAGTELGAKIAGWAHAQLAQYLRNNIEEFHRLCAKNHDGVTLRITMTRIPGIEALRRLSQGKVPSDVSRADWLKGTPTFRVIARQGYTINRLRA